MMAAPRPADSAWKIAVASASRPISVPSTFGSLQRSSGAVVLTTLENRLLLDWNL